MKVKLEVMRITGNEAKRSGFLVPGYYVDAHVPGEGLLIVDSGYAGYAHGTDGRDTRVKALRRAKENVRKRYPDAKFEMA